MTLPPVVSDPGVCPKRWNPHSHMLPHDWRWASLVDSSLPNHVVCRYCGGRKP